MIADALRKTTEWMKARWLAHLLIRQIESGNSAIVFAMENDGEPMPDDLLAAIDEAVRRMPAPLGADDFLVRVRGYAMPPDDGDGEISLKDRRLVEETCLDPMDRYYDWSHGDGLERVRQAVEQRPWSPSVSLIAVVIVPLGGALARLIAKGKVSPVRWAY